MTAVVLSLAVLLPSLGNAQTTDEPVLVNGLYFYPTREFRIFDANVMTQVASAQRGPVYVDSTLAANTVVYVSVGGKTMKAYKVGEPPTVTSMPAPAVLAPAASETRAVDTSGSIAPAVVGTSGTTVPAVVGSGARSSNVIATRPAVSPRPAAARRGTPSTPLTTLQPEGNTGIWIEYDGVRYYADGVASTFSDDRFNKIGEYRGFPVYRGADDSNKDRIWVMSAIDGPVAPFVKR
jgi:hypothetical protein